MQRTRATYGSPRNPAALQSRRGSPTDLQVPGLITGLVAPERATTPLTQIERELACPSAEGITRRLKALAEESNTSLYEVLRRLSEAERASAALKQAADDADLDDFVARYPVFADLDRPACLRLELPLASWEHVAETMIVGGLTPGGRPSTALYWRAHARSLSLRQRRASIGIG